MAVENAPWAVHGASHSAAVARVAQYNAVGGASGIGAPGDLQVRAMQTPSGQVRIDPGGVSVKNEYPGAVAEVYTARNVTETRVDVPASGSAGARTHYVVARIRDPQFAGETQPEGDPKTAQYFFLEVVSSIPKNVPVEPLAKIDVPANTAAITDAMITDLRQLANPRVLVDRMPRPVVFQNIDGNSHSLRAKRNGTGDERGEQFPDAANGGRFNSYVPQWANRVHLTVDWTSVVYDGRSSWGAFYIRYIGKDGVARSTQDFGWDVAEGAIQSTNWLLRDNLFLPSAIRGGPITFYLMAFVEDASTAAQGAVRLSKRSGLMLEAAYHEAAEWTGVS